MEEIWKPVLGYEDFYLVSNYGKVKRSNRNTKQYGWGKKERILHYNINNSGYYMVGLCVHNRPVKKLVHRLVWEAFNGPIPQGMQVNHINEDKTDNRLENLNLMSPQQNLNWGTHNKRASEPNINGKASKPVIQYSLNGTVVKDDWPSIGEIIRQNKTYDSGTISKCCNGKQKTAYGYKWGFKTTITP